MIEVKLPDGQFATLRERLTYAQGREVRLALLRSEHEPEAKADVDLALVRAYVQAWNVLDLDGHAVPLESPELAPDDMIQTISIAAIKVWRAHSSAPKAGRETSPSTLRAVG